MYDLNGKTALVTGAGGRLRPAPLVNWRPQIARPLDCANLFQCGSDRRGYRLTARPG